MSLKNLLSLSVIQDGVEAPSPLHVQDTDLKVGALSITLNRTWVFPLY